MVGKLKPRNSIGDVQARADRDGALDFQIVNLELRGRYATRTRLADAGRRDAPDPQRCFGIARHFGDDVRQANLAAQELDLHRPVGKVAAPRANRGETAPALLLDPPPCPPFGAKIAARPPAKNS